MFILKNGLKVLKKTNAPNKIFEKNKNPREKKYFTPACPPRLTPENPPVNKKIVSTVPVGGHSYFNVFNRQDGMGLPGNGRLFFPTRRVILQPRGGRFCNYEEKNFATTRRLQNEWI